MEAGLMTLASTAFDCSSSPEARNATLGPLAIDYLYIHYCVFAGAPLVSFAVGLLWLCLLFFFLGSTADGYFSPTLASISEKLHVPYDVAGVTFLAFGNGAPDVFSAMAAYSSGVGEAGINELLGGSMFVSTVVVGCVAIVSTVDVQRWAFSRDVAALILSLLLLLMLESRHSSSGGGVGDATYTHQAGGDLAELVLLLAYAVYVSSVVLPACISRVRRASLQADHQQKNGLSKGVLSAFWLALSPRGHSTQQHQNPPRPSSPTYGFVTKPSIPSSHQHPPHHTEVELGSPRRKAPEFFSAMVEDHFQAFDVDDDSSLTSPLISDDDRSWAATSGIDASELSTPDSSLSPQMAQFSNGARILEAAYWRHLRWRWRLRRRIGQVYGGSESALAKLMNVPQIPLVLLRDITVPLLDPDTWSRSLAALSWVTVPLLVLWTSGRAHDASVGPHETPLWLVLLLTGWIAAVVVFYTTHRSRPPDSLVYSVLFLLLAFVACVCWIYTAASELVALLVAVGAVTHASNSLLGLTVLSWGNSVGDLITNVSVARAGFPEMAIAGCFGGPVFNILLGLGIPMMLAFLRGEAQLLGFDDHAWISMGFLFVTLVSSYWVFRRNGFTCPVWYAKVLLVYYAVYATINVAVALHKHSDGDD